MTRFARLPLFPQVPLLILGLLAAIFIPLCVKRNTPPPTPELPEPSPAPPPIPAPLPPILDAHALARPALLPVAPAPGFPRSPLADDLNTAATTAQDDLHTIGAILRIFRERFGDFPAFETNAQLVNALAGANPRRIALLPRDIPAVSPEGELLDRWGTPYEFHAISHEALELRTAGPDRALHTADDLTLAIGFAASPP